MVTRLYTPLIPLPVHPAGAGSNTSEETQPLSQPLDDATQSPPRQATRTAQQQAWLARQSAAPVSNPASATFTAQAAVTVPSVSPTAAVSPQAISIAEPDNIPLVTVAQHTQAQQITGTAVLHDFGQTADLLGAPDTLKAQLSQYLGIVAAESRQPQPDPQLIASVIQRAAKGLDDHVTQSLGQPSTVVSEWVSALLAQPIDWSDTQPNPSENLPSFSNTQGTTPPSLDTATKTQVMQHLQTYRTALASQNPGDAHLAVDQALTTLQPFEAPELKGKFYRLKGKLSAQQGDLGGAIDATQLAIEQLQQASQADKIAPLWQELGRYHQQAGQPDQARAAWEAGLSAAQSLPDSGAQQAPLWQSLGHLALTQNQPQTAVNAFQSARQLSPQPVLQQEAAFSLAQAHRRDQQPQLAERAYRDALSLAKQLRQPDRYRQTLTQLTSLYIEQGQTAKAQRLMPLLSKIT